jgi:hypothetical protein
MLLAVLGCFIIAFSIVLIDTDTSAILFYLGIGVAVTGFFWQHYFSKA